MIVKKKTEKGVGLWSFLIGFTALVDKFIRIKQ